MKLKFTFVELKLEFTFAIAMFLFSFSFVCSTSSSVWFKSILMEQRYNTLLIRAVDFWLCAAHPNIPFPNTIGSAKKFRCKYEETQTHQLILSQGRDFFKDIAIKVADERLQPPFPYFHFMMTDGIRAHLPQKF